MFSRLLVPIDFSPPSDAALVYARALARRYNAPLHLIHVAENLFLRAVVADPRDAEATARRQLDERFTAEDRARGAVSIVERSDEPADEIVSYAKTIGTDLIVMGTHGRSGIAHFLVGSVAEKVVRSAPCPVLTVREARILPKAALFSRILVPVDFSEPSDAALDYARLLAGRFGSSLHLLHVVEEPIVASRFGSMSEMYVGEDSPAIRAELLKNAQKQLAHRVTAEDRSGLRATSEVMFGTVADTIARYADVNGYDLVVMGTHGRSGMAHLLMGSVAERVVRTSRCPVLTTHAVPATARVPAGATAAAASA